MIKAKAPSPRKIRKSSGDVIPMVCAYLNRELSIGLVSNISGLPNTAKKGITEATPAVSNNAIPITIKSTNRPRLRSLKVRRDIAFFRVFIKLG